MTPQIANHAPLRFVPTRKAELRTQFAALCWRVKNGKVEVLLITSRRSKSWIIPKGWPIQDLSPVASAATEAWEEAGVIGDVAQRPLSVFSYLKEDDSKDGLACLAMVYSLHVKKLAKDYPEKSMRKRKWFPRKKAAKAVASPELSRILRDFDPRKVH